MKEELRFEYAGGFAELTETVRHYMRMRTMGYQSFVDYLDKDCVQDRFTVKLEFQVTRKVVPRRIRLNIAVYDRPRRQGGSVMLEYHSRPMNVGMMCDGRVESAVRRVAAKATVLSSLKTL